MTGRVLCVMALVLAACGGDEETKPPPISTGETATLTLGGSSVTMGTDTNGTDGSGTDTDPPVTSSMSEDSSGSGGAPFMVVSGAFIDGGADVNLPIECRIKFYMPGQVEPSTAMENGGHIFQLGGFIVDAYPQSFAIESNEVSTVELGQEGYIVAFCDGDGDGLLDDNLGGYYPDLPLQLVTIPATNVFIPIQMI